MTALTPVPFSLPTSRDASSGTMPPQQTRPAKKDLLASLATYANGAGAKLYSKTDSILQRIKLPRKASKASKARNPHRPAYLEPCYKWLLENLHNPYPSNAQRQTFSLETGSSMKDITAWFVSARQRIGWSDLRAKHFERSQIGIVEAASRFWPERNTQNPLPPDLELRFAEIEANAVGLYADLFTPSAAMLASLKRRQQAQAQESRIAAYDISSSKGKKRGAADADLQRPTEFGPSKKTRRTSAPHLRAASLDAHSIVSTKKRRHASLPTTSFGASDNARASGSSPLVVKNTPSLLPPPLPKFGETSLAAPAMTTMSLKRSRDSEEPANEEPNKRPCILPTWPDPKNLPIRSKASHPRTTTSSSPPSERAARRDRLRIASDPQASTTQPLPLEKASARATSLPPLPDPTSSLPAPILPWPLPSSPPPQLISTPSTELSTDLPTPQSDMAFLTMDDASCTWAIDGVSQFDVNAVPDPNSLDMTLGDPFLQGDPYFELPATFADIDWDALLSQPPPCEPQPLPWEPQPLRCESQPLPGEPHTTAQWDIYGTSTEPVHCGQDTFAPTYGEELPLGQFLTGFTDDLVAPEPIAATA